MRLCADTLQRKTKEYTGDDTDRLGAFKAAAALQHFGVPENQRPFRPHGNDAGADVYMPYDCTLQPGEIAKIPLGFGIEVPDGYAGFVFPRTSMAIKGLVCELPPVDFG